MTKEVVQENKMGIMPVNRLLITMALPMMVSMLVQALYNVVDSIFVSWICEDALTAVSMAFPMQNLLIGVGSGLGVGTNALLSRSLGAGDREKASDIAMHGMLMAGGGYLLFLTLGLTVSRAFFVVQGASDTIADYGRDYLFVVLVFSFGIFGQLIFERLLTATGKTLFSMFTQGTGAIINIILDPILIFGYFGMPAMGIRGAAVATVVGQIVAAVIGYIFNKKINREIELNTRKFKYSGDIIRQILYIGVPSVIMMAIGSVMTFSVNKILVVFGSTAVAVFGVYFKLQSFAFMPIFGINSGMVPIVAYNMGAGKPDRMVKTIKLAMLYAEIIMITAMITVQCIPDVLLGMFSASQQMLAIGVPALRIISISFVFAGICVIGSSTFQAVGNGGYSAIVSFARQMIFLVPLVFVFSKTGNIHMVWLAWPIAEIASVSCSAYFLGQVNKKIIIPMRNNK